MKTSYIFITAIAILLSGCTIVNPVVPETGHYYINPDSKFGQIAKVAFIELDNYSDYPGQTRDITEAAVQALQKKHIFNIRIIRKSDPDYADLQLERDTYSLDELSATPDADARAGMVLQLYACSRGGRDAPSLCDVTSESLHNNTCCPPSRMRA